MSQTNITLNVVDDNGWADSMPLLIVVACVTIGIIAFLYGLSVLRRRRHAHERDHLVVNIAEPETLRDLPPEERP